MSPNVTASKGHHLGSKLKAMWATSRLLYQVDARAFLINASAGVMESLFDPLLLLIVWKGFSLNKSFRGAQRGGIIKNSKIGHLTDDSNQCSCYCFFR
ncbi:MAG: hypothetical protein E6I91_03495 [Chloroflexi bacterium]|nr:MAG: hypothetical protein E6I91_03495 [Chloroflexota bacterium]